MSVLVKGMEIPRDCPSCPLSYWANHTAFLGCRAVPGKKYAMREEQYRKSDTPPDWCPLRPLPEKHGDLIDRDALPKYTGYALSADEVANAVEKASAIVEAEGD